MSAGAYDHAEGIRLVWEEREGLRHAVTVSGEFTGPNTLTSDTIPMTDCGVQLPNSAPISDGAITCEACLWGWLDPVVREEVRVDEPELVPA